MEGNSLTLIVIYQKPMKNHINRKTLEAFPLHSAFGNKTGLIFDTEHCRSWPTKDKPETK